MKLTTYKHALATVVTLATVMSQQALYASDEFGSQNEPVILKGKAINVTTPDSEFGSQFISDSSMYSGSCIVGPRSGDVTFTCYGFGFPATFPRQVFCQTRQNDNVNFGFPDQFACQIIRTSPGSVTFRIRRMDDGTSSSGWGQNLRADLQIIN